MPQDIVLHKLYLIRFKVEKLNSHTTCTLERVSTLLLTLSLHELLSSLDGGRSKKDVSFSIRFSSNSSYSKLRISLYAHLSTLYYSNTIISSLPQRTLISYDLH